MMTSDGDDPIEEAILQSGFDEAMGDLPQEERTKMPYEERDNSGVLFKNEKKQSERHPDYQGKVNVGGTTYRISGWLKDFKNGKKGKFMSLAISRPREDTDQRRPVDDEDIPF